MLPDELRRFGQGLVAVATFSSNIYFWRTTDYFAPAAEEQPLLHTWSLAVEEQYYVLFPLFLMLCWRFGKSKVFWLTTLTALLSILLAEWSWRNQPIANFYLLPTRAWELLVGSLIAFLPRKLASGEKANAKSQTLSLSGFIMIVYSILFFDSNTPFPSVYTVVPVLGSVLVIIYTQGSGVVRCLLASKPVVGVGLISYSAYLWHQPIFAFLRIQSLAHPSKLEFAFGTLASLVLAYLTWRLIEQPTRTMIINRSTVFRLSGFGLFVFLIVGSAGHVSRGFENRFVHLNEDVKNTFKREEANCFDKPLEPDVPVLCSVDKDRPISSADYLLLGDSHMYSLLPAFRLLENEEITNQVGAYVGYSGCPPLSNIYALRQDQAFRNCFNLNEQVFDLAKKMGVKKVVLVSRWTYYTDGGYSGDEFSFIANNPETSGNKENSRAAFVQGLSSTMKRWKEQGITVVIVTQIPQQKYEPKKIYLEALLKNDPNIISSLSIEYPAHLKLQEWVNKLFVEYENSGSLQLIRPDYIMCDISVCRVGETQKSFYYDDDHVSILGAKRLAPVIKKAIE